MRREGRRKVWRKTEGESERESERESGRKKRVTQGLRASDRIMILSVVVVTSGA